MSRDPGRMTGPVSDWERRNDALVDRVPYALLAASTVLALIVTDQPLAERIVTAVLAAAAGAWVFALYTRSPTPRRDQRGRMLVYFVGLMVLASVLMARHPMFFIFAITGFFHAVMLRPWPLSVAGVAVTSTLINTIITGFPWPTVDLWILFGSVIVIQTIAIGFGTVVGERLAEQSEGRRQAVARLEEALEENTGLHRQLVAQAREAGVLDERGRMAREIHDTIAHGLTGVITQLEAAQHATDRPVDQRQHIENAARLARESLVEARRSVEASRPEALVDATLPAALAALAQQWSAFNGIPVEVTTTGALVALHPEIESALLRTAQEALANVAKHANASRAGVTLSYMGDVVTLDVRDDGVGFAVPDGDPGPGRGFGLTAMGQRVSRVAGTLAIESEPGAGTAISARVPAIAAPEPSTGT